MREENWLIRPATDADAAAIYRLILRVMINPLSLNWRRFIVVVDRQGRLLGCGQVKMHADGSRELASIAVRPGYQRQGIGSQIIRRLLEIHPLPLYLTCRASLESYYIRFGFQVLDRAEMPPYFQRIDRLFHFFRRAAAGKPEGLLVMRKTE